MKKVITILGAIMVVSLINASCGSEPANNYANEKDSTSIVTDSIKIVAEETVEKVTNKMYTSNLTSVDKNDDSFIDKRDGKKYKTKKIGSQIWMTENLAYKPSSGNYFVYNNDKDNVTKYGYLYDWPTACKVCPSGWRLPSNEDYLKLTDFLGQDFKQKMMIKSAWSSDENASNVSGFSGLPAGMRDHTGNFRYIGTGGYFWTSSFSHQTFAFAREIGKNAGNWASYEFGTNQDIGMSVRCLKANKTTTSEVKNEIMTLISGASQDCTTIIFKNSKGKEIYAGDIPDFIKWNDYDGSTKIDKKFCNKKYLITYTMKKYYCESSGDKSGSLEMNVSKMEIVK